jgi:hypothetical protein
MKDGEPLSWRHFVYGSQHLGRKHARDSLKIAGAAGIAQAVDRDRERWFRQQTRAAGW